MADEVVGSRPLQHAAFALITGSLVARRARPLTAAVAGAVGLTFQTLMGDAPAVAGYAAILILSQYVEERYASDLLSSGARGIGYLLKDRVADVQEFVAAAVRVAAGGTVIDPEVVAQLIGRRPRPVDALTPREIDVLSLMAEGNTNGAIVDQLGISHSAVEKHVRKVFGKLGLPETDQHHRRVLAVLTYLGV